MLGLHLHNTFGYALGVISMAVSELAVRSLEGSVAGLGGCPFAGDFLVPNGTCFGRSSEQERTLPSDELRNEIGEHVRVSRSQKRTCPEELQPRDRPNRLGQRAFMWQHCRFGRVVLANRNHNEKTLVRHLLSPTSLKSLSKLLNSPHKLQR